MESVLYDFSSDDLELVQSVFKEWQRTRAILNCFPVLGWGGWVSVADSLLSVGSFVSKATWDYYSNRTLKQSKLCIKTHLASEKTYNTDEK